MFIGRRQAIEINSLFSITEQLFYSNIVKTCHASTLQKIRTFKGPAKIVKIQKSGIIQILRWHGNAKGCGN